MNGQVIIGLVVVLVGALLLYFKRSAERKGALIGAIPTTSAAEVAGLQPGTVVEVKGLLRCESPLVGQYSQRPCVYFDSSVTREYEVREQDSEGQWRTERRSETVATDSQRTTFQVEDSSGSVRVDPERGEVESQAVVDRYEPYQAGMEISLGGLGLRLGSNDGTLGYRYRERILASDIPVYVLGVVREDGAIGAPVSGSGGQRLLISHRSEEAIQASLGSQVRGLLYGAVGSFALGVLLIAVGLVRH